MNETVTEKQQGLAPSISHEEALKHEFVPSDFVHLHNHTTYSVLDGLTKMEDLIGKVKEFGMESVAVTDHGTMGGDLTLYKKAKAAGLKPILGIETYVAARGRKDRDPAKDKQRFHLTILAMNNQGWQNMMRLSSLANLEGMYYKPRIDHELLEKYNEGLIILSGCASSEVSVALKTGDYEHAVEVAKWYKEIFGDRYYLEMQDHGHPKSNTHWEVQGRINDGLKRMSKELNIPLVVTCDGHYLTHDCQQAHEILLCVGTGAYLSDKNRMSLSDFELHLMDPREIIDHWADDCPEAILNTKRIAERCNVDIELGRILIPKFPSLPEGDTEHTFFHKLVYRGLLNRYNGVDAAEAQKYSVEKIKPMLSDEVRERAEMELSVIGSMGYEGYFLIVQDFINWGKSQGYVFGPGRGSAAGSIVSYAIKITDIDPLKYNLLFERFLNPDRISMPDIDVDMQDTCRDDVINYCADKYGHDHVCNIVTFGTMASRSAVRDVARVLEVPYAESDRLSKLVPTGPQSAHIGTLREAMEKEPDMKREYETNPTAKRVYDFAMQLEGTIRSHGVHACGTVIAPEPLLDIIPLEVAQKGVITTQFPAPEVEEMGLLKMDFLGLSNLTIIDNCRRIIRKVYGDEIDLENLSLDDEETYKLLQRGDTTGVFQLESAGMKRYLKELKPTRFDDIIAMVALYRPGPMQFIDSFIKRKHGLEKITYPHPSMKPQLEETYGVLVYQEQFMLISKACCGFTGGEADTLRKAVAKKKKALMDKMKDKFIEGGVKTVGADRSVMETFWTQLEDFASYCFNKSHAACYALIAYWTAFLKAHYPDAFMAALMSSDSGDTDRLTIEISECNRLGLKVLNPDINESFREFAVVKGTNNIRFGLAAIKSVGSTAIDDMLEQRKKDGPFKSIEDFARRVNSRTCNRKVYESLIKAGTFDCFETPDKPSASGFTGSRSDLLVNLDNIIAYSQKVQKEAASGQGSLLDMLGGEVEGSVQHLDMVSAPTQHSDMERLAWERELLGLFLSAHPLDRFDTFLNEQTNAINKLSSDHDGALVAVGGLVSKRKDHTTKTGSKMLFMSIEDKTGEIETVVFPKTYEKIPQNFADGDIVLVKGRISGKDKDGNRTPEPSVVVDSLQVLDEDVLKAYQPTGVPMGDVDMSTVGKRRGSSGGGRSGGWKGGSSNSSGGGSYSSGGRGGGYAVKAAVVKSTPPIDMSQYKVVDASKPRVMYIHVKDPADGDKLVAMKAKVGEYKGADQVILVLGEATKKSAVRMPIRTRICEELEAAIGSIYGSDCVAVR